MFSRSRRTALLLMVAAAAPVFVLASSVHPASSPKPNATGEAARIEAHLARVEGELRERDVHALTPAQRRARTAQIARLHEYRLRGRFPHNHDYPGRRVPYFADQHGTLCAMAYLIEGSGRGDIVRAVRARANNARVTELAADPELGPALSAWLETAGLTLAEAQRIQPAYGYEPDEDTRISTGYGVASGALGAMNLVSVAVNGGRAIAGRGPSWTSVAGILTGAGQMALGGANIGKEGERRVLGIANVVVGFASLAASVVAVKTKNHASTVANSATSLTVQPTISGYNADGLALGVRARF